MIRELERLAKSAKRRLREVGRPYRPLSGTTTSYSQCGEDRIVAFLCDALGILEPTYLDVGANDPIKLSNTYLLYRRGARGVCVEPNPDLYRRLKRARPRDVCLNIGIGDDQSAPMPFYQFGPRANGLSTFSKEQAEANAEYFQHPIEKVLRVSLRSINTVIREHLKRAPNFLSIDVEGLDLDVLRTLDFQNLAPEIICAETILHAAGTTIKDQALTQFLLDNGYRLFADTYINSIFVRTDRFPKI